MFYTTSKEADDYIEEDLSYFDLTTYLIGIEGVNGRIEFFAREDCVISGAEEVEKIFENLSIKIVKKCKSGARIKKGELIFSGEGESEKLHKAWKVSANIFEYASGIATRTDRLCRAAKEKSKDVIIATTRKVFPGTKKLSLKSVLAGGGIPHRQSLADSILIFKNHLDFIEQENIKMKIENIKKSAPEKKVLIEADNVEEAIIYSDYNIDGIQIDKADVDELKKCIKIIKEKNPNMLILAAGGINENNISLYAETKADVLVTTSVYFGKPIDIRVKMSKI